MMMPTEGAITIGWATRDITPERPVQLMGQYHERISQGVRDPISATALALGAGDQQAVIVSCDTVYAPEALHERTRALLRGRAPDLHPANVVLAATHTHTGPVLEDGGWYPMPPPGVMRGSEYAEFLAGRLADLVAEAWTGRRPGAVSGAFGRAAVGHNRRVVYRDGSAQMYGNTDTPLFVGLEGGDDDGVELLCTWDLAGKLTGVAINVACPSQVVENLYVISADYWGEVRQQLCTRLSPDLFILPLCGAAGDQSPRDMVRRGRGEPDMWSEPGLAEIGRRIATAVEGALPAAAAHTRTALPFRHVSEALDLPARRVAPDEVAAARARLAELAAQGTLEGSHLRGNVYQCEDIIRRYERQGDCPLFRMELHVLRIGEMALATNPFELYLDYGLRIKARSRAQQTLIVQLAGGVGGYLPTARAVAGGGYGALVQNGEVGPEGGQVLVDRTVELINALMNEG